MQLIDFMALIHPTLAVIVIFPLIGIAVNMALQTRQRRLQTTAGGTSKIPHSRQRTRKIWAMAHRFRGRNHFNCPRLLYCF